MKQAENIGGNGPAADGDRPECYGDMSKVCPRDDDGISQPRVECLPCGFLRSCLQHGLREQGVIPRPFSETPVVSKVSGFLKRWSSQKLARTKSGEK